MSRKSQRKGPVKQIQHDIEVDDEEENSTDSVEQAALEAASKDDNMFDQDSLMFGEGDDDFPAVDDEVPESRESRLLSGLQESSPDLLLDDTDSTINTPYGSPLSAISSFSSIQKWTGEVKKMLLEDQRESQSRTKGWIFPLPESLPIPTFSSSGERGDAEGLTISAEVEGAGHSDSDFDMMPTAEELAEKYSNELIEKENSILQKESRILELEKSYRDLQSTLEDCQKELRIKTESATSGVEKLKLTLEEKDKCIMETSERLRKVTESYNSSEKRWKDQQDFLEKQIQKLKDELETNSSASEELERLKEAFESEKKSLEDALEKSKQEIDHLKQVFSIEKAELEEELQNLKEEKSELEEQLGEEIKTLKKKLDVSQQAVEAERNEKEAIRLELETQEEKNRALVSDLDELKVKEDLIVQQQNEKSMLEETISALTEQKKKLEELLTNEKYELEVQVQSLKEQLESAKREAVEETVAPVNFFQQESEASTSDWHETKKSMEDRIAELEVEKGNLLLQLVDVDEQQEADKEKQKQTEALSEESKRQELELETLREELRESQLKIENLEKDLEESKVRDTERIETAISTIAWEEKLECLQKQNQSLIDELNAQRQAADDLSGRYEELEKKYSELELAKPTMEGLVEIDKCDGWSDDTPQLPDDAPQLPDEGFTEDPIIAELKEALEEKQREIENLQLKENNLMRGLAEEKERVVNCQSMLDEALASKTHSDERLLESMKELETLRQELQEKTFELEQQQVPKKPVESGDGWADDVPVLDEGFNDDNQITELKDELARKSEELTKASEKHKALEEKLKKALKAIKQKNDKLNELKKQLGEDPMTASTTSVMETSVVQEPVVARSVAFEADAQLAASKQQEIEALKADCQMKETRIKEFEYYIQSLQESQSQNQAYSSQNQEKSAHQQETEALLAQRDAEITSLRNELSQLASSLDSKNEEVEQLMKACGDMQKSVDEKVELLNDCVAKKDEEVRQAIAQYEDILKDATLNVSQLTKELEIKIHEFNVLQAQLQEAQESLYNTQSEFESYKAEVENSHDEEKSREIELLQQNELQLQQQVSQLHHQLQESMNTHALLNEALERAEAEKHQLREESVCIQNEYGNKNKELQVQISQLIDQLNERETAISILETRLKESDDISSHETNEIRNQLEEKSKAIEQIEQTLFVKTEECVRLEERIRETEENSRLQLEAKIQELQERHRLDLENYAMQNSEDLERTCEQLANRNSEIATLQETCRQLQEQAARLQEDYNAKCAELSTKEQAAFEVDGLRSHIQSLEGTIAQYVHALNNANAEINAKTEEVKKFEGIISQYEERFYESAMKQEQSQRTLQETQAALAQAQQDAATYYNELQNAKTEAETLQKSCHDYKEALDKTTLELNQLKSDSSNYSAELENLNNQLARYQEVETSLNQANADVTRFSAEVQNLNNQLVRYQDMEGKLSQANSEVARMSSELQNLNNQLTKYKDMEGNLNKYLEDLNSATEELGRKNSEMREMEKAYKTLETQVQSLDSRSNWFETESKEKDDVINERDNRISELEAEVSTLRASQEETGSSQSKYVKELLEEIEEKSKEISDLRFELDEGVLQERSLKKTMEEKERELQSLQANLDIKNREMLELKQQIEHLASIPKLSSEDEPLAQRIKSVEDEKAVLERKIDLLQSKLAEVESSEVKAFEDMARLKILRTELEMDNLRMSAEFEQLKRSLHEGASDPKYKAMENQLVLMTKTLEDRDKLCRDLMKNISELQEAHDALKIQVNDLQLLQYPPQYDEESVEARLLDLESEIFSLRIDIDREKKIRELYEGLLFLATSKKQFENTNKSSTSGSWFGLGELFSSPAPPPVVPRPQSSPRLSLSASMAQSFTSSHSHYGAPPVPSGSLLASTPARPLTPISPSLGQMPAMFETPGSIQHQPQQPLSLSPVPQIRPLDQNLPEMPVAFGHVPGRSAI